MKALNQRVEELVDRVLPAVVRLRHGIHQRPEMACCEFETAAAVRRHLAPLDLTVLKPFLKTDVVALLHGAAPGRSVALRADMDALPLQEQTDLPYRSRVPGCMHACGHDGHTAMLCGAATVLNRLRPAFAGSVRFVFQPGEEVVAAGRDLVAAGALEDPAADFAVAIHAWAGLDTGMIAANNGLAFAAAGSFNLCLRGRGGHGSTPHKAVDPLLTGARIVAALQSIPASGFSAWEPVVLTVTRFEAGHNSNVIPNEALIEGTVRTRSTAVQREVWRRMRAVVDGICQTTGVRASLSCRQPYVPLFNDPGVVGTGRETAQRLFGRRGWADVRDPSMGGEDFAYFIQRRPGALFRLGNGKKSAGNHNPLFDFNDNALRNGILFHVHMALTLLGAPSATPAGTRL